MALEAGDGFISGLVATNPVNATDQVAQGDDHIRLIKTAVKGTFPNLTGAVTASQAELNILDGATLSTAELNILDGATLSTAELNILDGVTLTAAQINEAARLSASNVFTGGTQTISSSAAGGPTLLLREADQAADEKDFRIRMDNKVLRLSFTNDAFGIERGILAVSRGTGAAVAQMEYGNTTDSPTHVFRGAVSSPGTSAAEVGYNGTPQNGQNGDYTLVLTDRGKCIYKASGGAGETITIPANGSVAFPVGTVIRIVNNGGGDLTIAITTDTLSLAGAGTTGSRTLSDHGVAVIEKVASTEWFISGVGLS